MTGDRDVLIPPANARLLAQRIPNARGVVVRDAGHVFVWEAPERAAAAVADFLAAAVDTKPAVEYARS
jgi:pimeloyl-ACP methyl ester carboxylesterase